MDKVSEFPHHSLAKITIPATVPNGRAMALRTVAGMKKS